MTVTDYRIHKMRAEGYTGDTFETIQFWEFYFWAERQKYIPRTELGRNLSLDQLRHRNALLTEIRERADSMDL